MRTILALLLMTVPASAQSIGLTVSQQPAATVAPGRTGTLTGTVTAAAPLTGVPTAAMLTVVP